MRIGIIASKTAKNVDLGTILPTNTSKLITSSTLGVGQEVVNYAKQHNIKLAEKFPDFTKHGTMAAFKRDCLIIESSDLVLFFWDGLIEPTLADLLDHADDHGIPTKVYMTEDTRKEIHGKTIKEGTSN